MDINHIPAEARFMNVLNNSYYARVSRTERSQELFLAGLFQVFDAKGRAYGHQCIIDREFWVIDANSDVLIPVKNLDDQLEETFVVYQHALRDGAEFGATPVRSTKRFRTLEQAEAFATKAIKAAEKRAIKAAS